MAKHSVSLPCSPLKRCSVIVHEDASEAESLEPRVCPLCKSSIQLFQIHFDEKFLMCQNVDCAWPFGYDDYHVYKIECSDDFTRRNSACSSTTGSNSDWSEIDRLMINSPMSPTGVPHTPSPSLLGAHGMEKIQRIKKNKETEALLQNNVKQIQALAKELYEDEPLEISNDKWIKQIAQMQERSGVQLLNQHELKKAKKMLPVLGDGELKIDIDASKQSISLKIALPNEE